MMSIINSLNDPSQITNFDIVIFIKKQILRFKIPMHNIPISHTLYAPQQPPHNNPNLLNTKITIFLLHNLKQIFSFQ